jgi:aminopeptidase N
LKAPAASLFFANAGGKGYYRSAYPPSVYAALVANAETDLSPTERISLTGDEWAQVRANKATVGDYLDLVTRSKPIPARKCWAAPLTASTPSTSGLPQPRQSATPIARWLRATFAPEYAKLPPPSDAIHPTPASCARISSACSATTARIRRCWRKLTKLQRSMIADPSSVEPTLGQTALAVAARNGDAALFDQLQKIAETSTNPEFQEGALRLLAEFEDPALVQRSLEYASSNKVRNQDALIQFAIALQIDATREAAWNYIKSHWDIIRTLLTPELGSDLVGSTGASAPPRPATT